MSYWELSEPVSEGVRKSINSNHENFSLSINQQGQLIESMRLTFAVKIKKDCKRDCTREEAILNAKSKVRK